MARLLITVLFAVVLVAILRIQAKDTNLISKKFLRKRETRGETDQLRAKRDVLPNEQDVFVEKHNLFRKNVYPKAATDDIKLMVWDQGLATKAQKWSDKCIFAHGQPDGSTGIGQNLYVGTGFEFVRQDPGAVVDYWHSEVENFNFTSNTCKSDEVCGHYTQEVWAESDKLGCGMKFCAHIPEIDFHNAWLVTCNYTPAGNSADKRPYEAEDA